jgi:peptidoglycan/LPS O-acetylase OafA/YrhL
MGVLISYLYYFKNNILTKIYLNNKNVLIFIMIVGLSWTPFFVVKESFFAKTFGFSLLYISFGILLTIFILEKSINATLDKLFSKRLVSTVSKIGFASFSIYYIHSFFIFLFDILKIENKSLSDNFISSMLLFLICIFSGILMTKYIEKYFLKIRDIKFPSRTTL